MKKNAFLLFFCTLLLMGGGLVLVTIPSSHRSDELVEDNSCDDDDDDNDDEDELEEGEDEFEDTQIIDPYSARDEEAELRRDALAHRLSVYVEPADTLPEVQRRAEANARDQLTMVKAGASREEIAAVKARLNALAKDNSAMLQEVMERYKEGLATAEEVLLTEAAYLHIYRFGAENQFVGLSHPARLILTNLQNNLEAQAMDKSLSAAERAMAQDKLTHWFPKGWKKNWFTAPQSSDPLAVDIFRLLSEQTEGNVVFSPDTLEKTLRLLRAGASGDTRAELNTLPCGTPCTQPINSPGSCALFIAEEAPLRSDFTPPAGYENCVQSLPLRTRPEEAAQAINRWSRENTGGKIPTIIKPADISPHVSMLAVSSLYFKRNWLQPFDDEYTEKKDFHLANGSTVHVPMMRATIVLTFAEGEDWEAVAVPYTDGLYFIGILPSGNARNFARSLTHDKLHTIRTQLAKKDPEKVEIYLPRFTCRSGELNLAPALKALGMRSAFDLSAADFSGFTKGKLFLSALVQQNTIEFTETGTTGTSITLAEQDDEELAEILFNRPFLWLIGDLDSGAAPLFMGLTENPL